MSRSLPEWIGENDDQTIPARVKVRLFEASEGRCQWCSRKFLAGDKPQYDHRISLINGGEHRETNLQVLCDWCHKRKTKVDVKLKSVVYRKKAKRLGLKRSKRGFRRWRSFSGEIRERKP